MFDDGRAVLHGERLGERDVVQVQGEGTELSWMVWLFVLVGGGYAPTGCAAAAPGGVGFGGECFGDGEVDRSGVGWRRQDRAI